MEEISKDAIIEQQRLIIRDQLLVIDKQRCELAERRQFSAASEHPWQYFWWLLLHDLWPFSIWYGRFN
jgi:hypothetical protein